MLTLWREEDITIRAEVAVNPRRSLVAPHMLAGKIILLNETEHISEYWSQVHTLEEFLRLYGPIGDRKSGQDWRHRETGEVYETPEVIIPLDAIDESRSRFLNK